MTIRSLGAAVAAALALLSLTACETETRFSANFQADAIGAVPSSSPGVGTLYTFTPVGDVRVVPPPVPSDGAHWVRVRKPDPRADWVGFDARLDAPQGNGTYTILFSAFVPTGTNVFSVDFESGVGRPRFFHLDFLEDGTLRVNDTAFAGTYLHDTLISLVITVNLRASGSDVTVGRFGGEGSTSETIPLDDRFTAFGFDNVKFYFPWPHGGSFFLDDISVLEQVP